MLEGKKYTQIRDTEMVWCVSTVFRLIRAWPQISASPLISTAPPNTVPIRKITIFYK